MVNIENNIFGINKIKQNLKNYKDKMNTIKSFYPEKDFRLDKFYHQKYLSIEFGKIYQKNNQDDIYKEINLDIEIRSTD